MKGYFPCTFGPSTTTVPGDPLDGLDFGLRVVTGALRPSLYAVGEGRLIRSGAGWTTEAVSHVTQSDGRVMFLTLSAGT